jgi:hypothetical protein
MKKQGFLKLVLSLLIITVTLYAKVPDTVIVTTQEVKEYVAKLPQNDQEFVNKAIEVGNKFASLHIGYESGYDEIIADKWNKKFNPLTTMSGDEWREIWIKNLSDEYLQNKFARIACNQGYLRLAEYKDGNVTLKYESLIFGMDNFSYADKYKFIKLNEKLLFELTIDKSHKITNVVFLTKNSDAGSPEWWVEMIKNDLKQSKNVAPKYRMSKKELDRQRKYIKDIEEASAICKEY